jgi:hypothetical protein
MSCRSRKFALRSEGFCDFSVVMFYILFAKSTYVGHVACIGTRGMNIGFWCQNQKERDHQGNLDVSARIILK